MGKYYGNQIVKHHRKMKKNGGDDSPRNIVKIPRKMHDAFHMLFGHRTTREIADLLNEVYLDPNWELLAVEKKWEGTW